MIDYLTDTNILLRSVRTADADFALVRTALRTLRERGDRLCYLPQNLTEFWNVCTRPSTARGGFGMTPEQTERRVLMIERQFRLLPDTPTVHEEWRRLVFLHCVQGVQVHDARIAAAMSVHGVLHILTLNPSDFTRYAGITAVHPSSI